MLLLRGTGRRRKPSARFYVNGLFLDIAFAPVRYDSGGNYSVLNDRWATRPRKDNLAARFSPGEIVKGYYLFRRRIEKPLQSLIFERHRRRSEPLQPQPAAPFILFHQI